MIPEHVMHELRYIEVYTAKKIHNQRVGAYQSPLRGPGFDFDEHQVYRPGDDVRRIDWNVTARLNAPFVRHTHAERELNVSVLQKGETPDVLAIAEIDFSAFAEGQARIVDYAAKWHADSFAFNNTPRMIPAPISDSAARRVRQQALAAWNAIGCAGYARVDFRMDAAERTYVIEVNPNPDISPDAGFAAALEKNEINYESFVRLLYDNALTGCTACGNVPREEG